MANVSGEMHASSAGQVVNKTEGKTEAAPSKYPTIEGLKTKEGDTPSDKKIDSALEHMEMAKEYSSMGMKKEAKAYMSEARKDIRSALMERGDINNEKEATPKEITKELNDCRKDCGLPTRGKSAPSSGSGHEFKSGTENHPPSLENGLEFLMNMLEGKPESSQSSHVPKELNNTNVTNLSSGEQPPGKVSDGMKKIMRHSLQLHKGEVPEGPKLEGGKRVKSGETAKTEVTAGKTKAEGPPEGEPTAKRQKTEEKTDDGGTNFELKPRTRTDRQTVIMEKAGEGFEQKGVKTKAEGPPEGEPTAKKQKTEGTETKKTETVAFKGIDKNAMTKDTMHAAREIKSSEQTFNSNMKALSEALKKDPNLAKEFKEEIAILDRIVAHSDKLLAVLNGGITEDSFDPTALQNHITSPEMESLMMNLGDYGSRSGRFEGELGKILGGMSDADKKNSDLAKLLDKMNFGTVGQLSGQPFQRSGKYALLLRELTKSVAGTSDDAKAVVKMEDHVKELTTKMNLSINPQGVPPSYNNFKRVVGGLNKNDVLARNPTTGGLEVIPEAKVKNQKFAAKEALGAIRQGASAPGVDVKDLISMSKKLSDNKAFNQELKNDPELKSQFNDLNETLSKMEKFQIGNESPNLEKRNHIMNEFLSTESTYNRNLGFNSKALSEISNEYQKSENPDDKISGTLTTSMKNMEKLRDSETVVHKMLTNANSIKDPKARTKALLDVFNSNEFKTYTDATQTCVKDYMNTNSTLGNLRKSNEDINNLAFKLRKNNADKGLEDTMITVVQRMPRYVLLLEDTAKTITSTENETSQLMQSTINNLKARTKEINDSL